MNARNKAKRRLQFGMPSSRRKASIIPRDAEGLRTFRLSMAQQLREQLNYYLRKEGQPTGGGPLMANIEEVLDAFIRQQEPVLIDRFLYQLDSAAAQFLEGHVTAEQVVEHVAKERQALGVPLPDAEMCIAEMKRVAATNLQNVVKQAKIAEALGIGLRIPDTRRGVRRARANDLGKAAAIWQPDTEHAQTHWIELHPFGKPGEPKGM